MTDTFLTLLRPPGRLGAPTGGTSPSPAAAAQVASNLQPGNRVLAQVLASAGNGQATLKVGAQAIQVRTTTPLRVGEQLNLEVTHAGRLLVLARRDGTGDTPRTIPQVTTNLLRQQLPVQRSLGEALGAVGSLAAAGPSQSLPRDLSTAAQQLLASLPRRETLTDAEGIARALRWATTGSTFSPSLSNLLANVLGRLPAEGGRYPVATANAAAGDELPPLPGQRPVPQGRVPVQRELPSYDGLRQQLQGAGARIDLLALTAMFPRPRERAAFASEIPVASPGETGPVDVIGVRVAHEAIPAQSDAEHSARGEGSDGGDGERQHRWRVELAFDLPGLGPLDAVITLGRENEVAVSFRSREGATAEVVQGRLGDLDRRLLARGLTVDALLAGRDPGPEVAAAEHTAHHLLSPMVDERA
ncbi:MAG: flagellar hook-length control protein FliK [Pseudomonadota bacterium]